MHSTYQIKYLCEKADYYIDSKMFVQAIKCLDQIIKNTTPHPYYYKKNGFCHRMLKKIDEAIENYNIAIKLDPDDGVTYWERGACYNDKPYFTELMDKNEKKHLLEIAKKDYKSSLKRIPTSQEAWLALVEADLCLFKFDEALCEYVTCKPYIHTLEYQLVRSCNLTLCD